MIELAAVEIGATPRSLSASLAKLSSQRVVVPTSLLVDKLV